MIRLYLASVITPTKTKAVAVSSSEDTAKMIARYTLRDKMNEAKCDPEDIIETLLRSKSPCGRWGINTDSVEYFGDSQEGY